MTCQPRAHLKNLPSLGPRSIAPSDVVSSEVPSHVFQYVPGDFSLAPRSARASRTKLGPVFEMSSNVRTGSKTNFSHCRRVIVLGHVVALTVGFVGACMNNELGVLRTAQTGDLSNGPAARAAFDADLVDACGNASYPNGSESNVLRAPYLQQTRHDGTLVMWVSKSQSAEKIVVNSVNGDEVISAPGLIDFSASLLPAGRQYVARIVGLEPNTIYCYSLHDGDQIILGNVGFKTAPALGSNEPIRFVTFGDLGTLGVDQFAVLEQLATVQFDLALVNGDVAYDSGLLEEFENHFFAVYSKMLRSIPFFVTSGNHDYATNDAEPYRQVFALPENGGSAGRERWYSFDWGNVHFVALDTERIGAEQAAWLDADLSRNRQPWVIVTGHRPAFSSGAHGSSRGVQEYFVPLFEKYQVPLVIAGHDHNYERTVAINGVTYLVAGAGGVGTRSVGVSPFTSFSQQVSHFVYVIIENDTLVAHAIDGSGAEFDTLKITRPLK